MLRSSSTAWSWHSQRAMAQRTLEQRVATLEKQMGGKIWQEHFREHAELIDQRFADFEKRQDAKWDTRLDVKLAALEKRWDAKLAAMEMRLDAKWEPKFNQKFESKFEEKFRPVRVQLTAIEDVVRTILNRLS